MEDKIYTIEGTDLNVYKKNKSYDSGNANPFEVYQNEIKANATDTTTKTVKDGTATTPEAMTQTEINNNLSNGETTKPATKIK